MASLVSAGPSPSPPDALVDDVVDKLREKPPNGSSRCRSPTFINGTASSAKDQQQRQHEASLQPADRVPLP